MYPKSFYAENPIKVKPGTCFLIMPFDKAFADVHQTMKKMLEGPSVGMKCTRTDDLRGGGNIIVDILRGIGESEIVLTDVTGQRANVFYELGIAHMCKDVQNVILLSQDLKWIPFDLKQFRYIVYKNTKPGLKKLSEDLYQAVAGVAQPVARIAVDGTGKGMLAEKLRGRDGKAYAFEIPECMREAGFAKLRLKVTQHALGVKPKVVFDKSNALNVDQVWKVGETDWAIRLVSVAPKLAVFDIQRQRAR